jgi:hypothetical protein
MNDPLFQFFQMPRRARRYGVRWLARADLLGWQPDPRENRQMVELLAPFRAAIGTAERDRLSALTGA